MAPVAQVSDANQKLLQEYLRTRQGSGAHDAPPIGFRPVSDRAPLSFCQRQVWLHGQMSPGLPIYNELITIHHKGALDIGALDRSFREIVRRHEMWRTTFDVIEGEPTQIIRPVPSEIELAFDDLGHLHPSLRRAEALQLATADARMPFDLRRGPLWRARVVRMSDEEDRIFMVMHQLIMDGVTAYRVLLPELARIYEAFARGEPSPLPELAIQYGDFAVWQLAQINRYSNAGQLEYWRRQLAGDLPVLQWPSDRARAPVQTFKGATESLFLPAQVLAPLRDLARSQGATLYMALVASFTALLHRYTGQTDLIVGTLTAGRQRPELDKLMGYFLNPLALRLDFSGRPSFREMLRRVRGVVLDALSNADVPFTELVRELQAGRDLSRNPFFTVMISLEPQPVDVPRGWDLTQAEISSGGAKVDMYLNLDERPDGIAAPILYNPDLFEPATVTRTVEHWQVLIAAAVAEPDLPVADLPLLTSVERRRLLQEWNTAVAVAPVAGTSCFHEEFETQVLRHWHDTAVVCSGRRLTYAELNRRANQLARYLRRLGAGREERIGICLERSLDLLVALLAVMKTGAGYVPMDPAYPRERLQQMYERAGCTLIVTQREFRGRLTSIDTDANGDAARLVLLDDAHAAIAQENADNLEHGSQADDLAYLIFTSGSTGEPKGVQIEHRSLMNLLASMKREPGLRSQDVLLSVTSVSFDIAALELFLPLLVGARLVIAATADTRDGRRLRRLLSDSRATVMQATPATWQLLIDAGWEGRDKLRVLCGGEAMSNELAHLLTDRSDAVWNLYGPTETTVWSAVYRVTGCEAGPPPIGRPIGRTEFYVLDAGRQPVPIGVTGELYIGGAGLARGYYQLPEETKTRFVPHPFSSLPGARLYRTGDQVAFLSDGCLEFRGRTDDQVKIRGFRVELGEIESALVKHSGVKSALALVRGQGAQGRYVVAYIVPNRVAPPTQAELVEYLRRKLPAYLIPAKIVPLEHFPLHPNGKVNRQALPEPQDAAVAIEATLQVPSNEVERRLVAIWEDILQRRPIGVRQDFWELGGHSLLAARMIYRAEREFSVELSVATLFQAPTIEALAALLIDRGVGAELAESAPAVISRQLPQAEIIPIQPHGTKPPLFCVCAHTPVLYRTLVRCLDKDQPIYGLALPPSLAGELSPPYSLEGVAECVARAMRAQLPTGPYYLGGFCMSGLIAYETARVLSAQGQKVAFVALFSTTNPAPKQEFSYHSQVASLLSVLEWRSLSKRVLHFRDLPHSRDRSNYLHSLVDSFGYRAQKLLWDIGFSMRSKLAGGRLREIPEILMTAARSYRPRPVATRLALFRVSGHGRRYQFGASDDPLWGWGDVIAPEYLTAYEVPGVAEGSNMFLEPHVQPLARELETRLREARDWAGQGRLTRVVSGANA